MKETLILWGCQNCKALFGASENPPDYNYCPYCGAKMDDKNNKEDTDNENI